MTGGGHGGPAAQPCLFLLFPRGERPTAADVRAALLRSNAGQISHDPAESEAVVVASDWLEVLTEGMTFDLLGLAPGRGLTTPSPRYHLGLPAGALDAHEAIGLAPGPHLSGAANALPVVRALLSMAAAMASRWGAVSGLLWHPSASAMARDLFVELTANWVGGGAFPSLGLVGITERGGLLASDGLAFFTGQELALDRALSAERHAATRLLVRLIDRLVGERPLREDVTLTLEDGDRVRLAPEEMLIRVAAD